MTFHVRIICIVIICLQLLLTLQQDYYDDYNNEEDTTGPSRVFGFTNISEIPCGIGLISIDNRIVNGKIAKAGQFPWMVLICYKNGKGARVGCFCSGTIITSRHVLTAAHCVSKLPLDFVPYDAWIGEYDRKTDPDCMGNVCLPPVQKILIESIVVHNLWAMPMQHNDIAIVYLKKKIDFSTTFARPICLPLAKTQLGISESDKINLLVAGWGKTQQGSESDIMQYAHLPVVPNVQCAALYALRQRRIIPSQICAGGDSQDSCNGDSGGPLMLVNEKGNKTKVLQIGIVSFGPTRCATIGMPGVYTRVPEFIDWILDKL